jgi:hypothetical protein
VITQIETNNNNQLHHHYQQQKQQLDQEAYNVSLQYNPSIPIAGHHTLITIDITEKQTGERVREFDVLHGKLMHVIIVSDDLAHFSHIHPAFDIKDGIFSVYHVFPEDRIYKIWIDFKPKNGEQTLVIFKFDNGNSSAHKSIYLTKESHYTKQIDESHQVKLLIPQEIESNKPVGITFNISDQRGNPITDLTPLMGAGGHSVIISNLQEFLHVHPKEEVSSYWKGGSAISFSTVFPTSGLYKIWGQFQHQGVTLTADFIVEVV